ncbi:MRNA stability protein [Fusarium sp. LHS14.1]|nr:MRNA stability protein [Fusarium sp. LHS14.1]
MGSPKYTETPTEKGKRAHHLYGISPRTPKTSNLLHGQLEERKYFDSGDFALSRAQTSSNIGTVTTGIEHPLRENISHPLAPVPSSSNVGDCANQDSRDEMGTGELRSDSHLKQEIASDNEHKPGDAKPESSR